MSLQNRVPDLMATTVRKGAPFNLGQVLEALADRFSPAPLAVAPTPYMSGVSAAQTTLGDFFNLDTGDSK